MFWRTLVQNFNWIRQQIKNFPIDPRCKNWPLSYNVAESGQFLQWGSMGKFFTRSRILMNFSTRVRLKRWNDQGEFELDRAQSKNNITENSVALGHGTHNRVNMMFLPRIWIEPSWIVWFLESSSSIYNNWVVTSYLKYSWHNHNSSLSNFCWRYLTISTVTFQTMQTLIRAPNLKIKSPVYYKK